MKHTILVVDDSSTSRYMVKSILTDFEVLDAESGVAMRKILEREIPDLILMDVIMPGENGYELARTLSDDVRYRDIPIIFLTARDSGKDVEEGFSAGGEDYIKKPYEEAELRARINAVLTKKHSENTLKDRNTKMELDLQIAQAAQKIMIQGKKPKCDRLVIESIYKPIGKVGGDYFSFFTASDVSLGFFIGDVSGHGLASALFIALLKSSTDRMFRKYGSDPCMYLKNLNNEITDYMASYFVTGIYGVFDSSGSEGDMSLKFSNGGHTIPIIARRNGATAFTGVNGTIIGIEKAIDYTENKEVISRGDRFFVYTDGIPEAINEKMEMIGFDTGLLALFDRSQRESLHETLDAIMEETHRFRGSQPLHDDITLIGFEVV